MKTINMLHVLITASLILTNVAVASAPAAAIVPCLKMETLDLQLGVLQKEINDAQKLSKKLKSDLNWTRAGRIALDVVKGVAAVAGAIIGLTTIESWISTSAVPAIANIIKTTGDAAHAAGDSLSFTINGDNIRARDAADARVWIETALERLEQSAKASPTHLVKSCVLARQCPAELEQISELFSALGKWYQAAIVTAPSNKESQLTELPLLTTTQRLLKLNFDFHQKLAQILRATPQTCGS